MGSAHYLTLLMLYFWDLCPSQPFLLTFSPAECVLGEWMKTPTGRRVELWPKRNSYLF